MPESFADALVPEIVDGAPVVPWMRGVEADGELAGFVMLAEVTDAHPEPYLWRLFVDRRHQRRGIGDRVLALVVERLRAEGHAHAARRAGSPGRAARSRSTSPAASCRPARSSTARPRLG